MMNRNPDILFTTEYIKNIIYFATVRPGKSLKSSADTHYFSIDDELIYENYYSDFGPLNLGCVYKYCKVMNEKLKQHMNRQTIVHYTSIDPKKKANAAFLLGCFGVLYLSLSPKDALKPLLVHGQTYRAFQDATQGDSVYTITITDCLHAIKKASDLGFFNFQDFNYEEYDRLDKIQGGDLNWIVPGKFLAFIGPVDYSVSLYHPPEMYLDYFLENNVRMVIRLNKRLYDGSIFSENGIVHYDLFFQDGSCPPRHILFKFLQISEDATCAIAVHCKAGLGRTGSLIGCYLIKHYRMTAHEAIGWMRICRPGSVIGHQQGWLEQLEPWLLKQGNLYRKRNYQDPEYIPRHEFGVYSIAEKAQKQRHGLPLPMQIPARSDSASPVKMQSKVKDDKSKSDIPQNESEEIFIASCDLTVKPTKPTARLKGCIIKNSSIPDEPEETNIDDTSFWKKYLCCEPCIKTFNDGLWMVAVRCASVVPDNSFNKANEKYLNDNSIKSSNISNFQKVYRSDQLSTTMSRRSGAGDPRATRVTTRSPSSRPQSQKASIKSNEPATKGANIYYPLTKFRSSQAPLIRNVNDAKNFLLRSSTYKVECEKIRNSTVTVTPQQAVRTPNQITLTGNKFSNHAPNRRHLGRSPSPPQNRMPKEQSRATNTIPSLEKVVHKVATKSSLREALSKLKLRDNSVGAASLGAQRDAPAPKHRAPSVRSDDRQLATQGDMLNCIKFQRRLRKTITKKNEGLQDKICQTVEGVSTTRTMIARPRTPARSLTTEPSCAKDKIDNLRSGFGPIRPMSPKGRRTPSFY